MSTASDSRNCSQCGRPLPEDAPSGLCPVCLMQAGSETTLETSTVLLDDVPESAGSRIGRYKLLQRIGEGGMGVVYMAEQEEPVRRRVALKIIKLGMDTRQVVARFEAERQALAMMDHPHIARVFDAGATASGRPYFVMELVKGIPITEYCDRNRLTTKERLELFIPVCRAVQHAHQKGIIHRDLKPSNVMVTLHDGTAVPKVIDFGVAKATHQRLTEKTLFTEFRQFIGTPEYMSPEQAELSGLDIDTRADIYSLGVLLYELLTGVTPLDSRQLRSLGYAEIQRAILEREPPKPSTRVSTFGEALTTVAGHRRADPHLLARSLQGDLDWIVMKALEKDRVRRYETANELAADLQRHLRDEPVSAAAPSLGYRLKKLARRNAAAVVFLITTLGICLVAMGVTLPQIIFHSIRRQKAETQVQALLVQERALRADAESEQADAVAAREAAIDGLVRGLYEEARGLRYRREIGRRHRALTLLAEAERLRSRPRPASAEPAPNTPERHALRSEALAAVLQRDVHRTAEVSGMTGMAPMLSGDGAVAAAVELRQDDEAPMVLRLFAFPDGAQTLSTTAVQLSGFRGALNSDGTWLAAIDLSADGPKRSVHLYEHRGDTMVMTRALPWPEMAGPGIPSLRFSPDDRALVAIKAGFRQLVLWRLDVPTADPVVLETAGATDWCAFSPDGRRMAYPSGPGTTAIMTLQANTEETLETPLFTAAAFQDNGTLIGVHRAADASDSAVTAVDLATGRTRHIATVSGFPVTAVACGGDRAVLGGLDGSMVLLSLSGAGDPLSMPGAHATMVGRLAWTSDGSGFASSGLDGQAQFWIPDEVVPLSTLELPGTGRRHTLADDTGEWLAVSDQPSEHESLDVFRRQIQAILPTPMPAFGHPAPPGGHTYILERTAETPAAQLPVAGDLLFSHDGQRLAVIQPHRVSEFAVPSGEPLSSHEPPDGRVATSAAYDNENRLHIIRSRTSMQQEQSSPAVDVIQPALNAPPQPVGAAHGVAAGIAGPRGETVLIVQSPWMTDAEGFGLTLWDPGHDAPSLRLFPPSQGISPVNPLLSPDGQWLAVTQMHLIAGDPATPGAMAFTLLDTADGTPIFSRPQPDPLPPRYAFSDDSRMLALADSDGTVHLYGLPAASRILSWQAADQELTSLQFTDNNTTLLACDGSSTLTALHLDPLHELIKPIGLGWNTPETTRP